MTQEYKDFPSQVVRLAAVTPHPENYVIHPKKQIEKLVASLTRFGQVKPIVVQDQADGTYLLVAGEGLYTAAKSMDWLTLEAKVLPAEWSPEEVEGYLYADNILAQGSQANKAAMAELLERQRDAKLPLESVGTTKSDMRMVLANLKQQKIEDLELKSVGFELYQPSGEMKPVERILEQFEQLAALPADEVDTALIKVAGSKALKTLVTDMTPAEVKQIEQRVESVAPAMGMKAMALALDSEVLNVAAKEKIMELENEYRPEKSKAALVIGTHHILLSDEEKTLLSGKVEEWRKEMGTLFGFMNSIIENKVTEMEAVQGEAE